MSPPQTTLPVTEAGLAPLLQPYGPYVLVRKLAEGGMAEIFLAKLLGADGFERNVVIKRMLPHLTNSPDFVEMFRDEARLAAKLAHPNIVQIQELGFADGCYYICMEYLAGEDFSTTLRLAGRRRHYVPYPVVLRVLIDAARGLHYAHEFCNEAGQPLNIVHGYIYPSNLYLTYQGQVKVLDFGSAKAESTWPVARSRRRRASVRSIRIRGILSRLPTWRRCAMPPARICSAMSKRHERRLFPRWPPNPLRSVSAARCSSSTSATTSAARRSTW